MAGGAVLTLSTIVFVKEQLSIASTNGWWVDELYSTRVTDPTLTFHQAALRFIDDPTPPLYYAVLYWLRRFVAVPTGQERTSAYILSISAVLLAAVAVVTASRRIGLAGFALAGVGAFLISGPVLDFFPEVRAYLVAATLVFVAAWFTALAIQETAFRPPLVFWAVLGVLAALTHLFAGLMCGCLAIGLLVLAVLYGRRDLAAPGLTLGLSASTAYAIWSFVTAAPKIWLTDHWTTFSRGILHYALDQTRQVEVGSYPAVAVLTALFVWACLHRSTRRLATAFGIAFAVFYILPVLISLKTPIIVDRYWIIGGPALVVMMLFLARTALSESTRAKSLRDRSRLPLAAGSGLVLMLLASSATGFDYSRVRPKRKYIWKGQDIVAPLARNCPPASIRVLGQVEGYAQLTRLPSQLFVDARSAAASPAPAAPSCPVLGWGEDLFLLRLTDPPDQVLLNLLKLDVSPSEVDIRRQNSGFVILRRNSASPATPP